jgi:hypothetical protein
MSRTPLLRFRPRYALLAVLCLLVGAATGGFATGAHAGAAVARPAGAGNWIAAVALPVPSPGDVSYAVARVRIAPGSRLSAPAGLTGQQTIFASRVGGLVIRAQSGSWRALRASTHVYVVVSMVPGASRSLRDVGFFVLRRNAPGGPARANVAFTIANARAQVGSFWVHGVDRRGYATVFAVRNILSTALANWSRYIHVLQLAHAIAAAAHPLILGAAPTASAAAATVRTPGPWTGGQRPDASVIAMYHLIVGSIGNPSSYALVKKDPAVADFIATELGNPALAARWSAVVAQVPPKVPDQYAAAAQEERRFTHVIPATITQERVAISDGSNSSQQGQWDGFRPRPMKLTVDAGTGNGTVTELNGGPGAINCSGVCKEIFPSDNLRIVNLVATPNPGYRFQAWVERLKSDDPSNPLKTPIVSPCAAGTAANTCEVWMSSDRTIEAWFAPSSSPPSYQVSVGTTSMQPGQDGEIVSQPGGIDCGAGHNSCFADFSAGTTVKLYANPTASSYFAYWNGCDSIETSPNSIDRCVLNINQPKYVDAYFGYP